MNDRTLERTVRARLRSEHLLAAAALLGLGLAALGAFTPRQAAPTGDAAARVNGVPVAAAAHEQIVEALAAGKRNRLTAEDRKHALTRLIDEELLLQRSIELGLHRSDATARKRLVAAMLEWIAADTADDPPAEKELRAFYKVNRALFSPSARIEAEWFHIARSEPNGEERTRRIADRLAQGEPFDEVAKEASPSAMPLPDGLLPAAKLRDYLGPSLAQETLVLAPGKPAGPFAREDGWHFLLVRRRRESVAAFEDVREQVEAEYRRQRADDAVRRYLGRLRRRANIEIQTGTDK